MQLHCNYVSMILIMNFEKWVYRPLLSESFQYVLSISSVWTFHMPQKALLSKYPYTVLLNVILFHRNLNNRMSKFYFYTMENFFILATLCNLSVMGQKQSPFIKREALAQVFSCEFWGFFKKSSLYITPQGCQIIVLWCNFCQKIPPIQLIK